MYSEQQTLTNPGSYTGQLINVPSKIFPTPYGLLPCQLIPAVRFGVSALPSITSYSLWRKKSFFSPQTIAVTCRKHKQDYRGPIRNIYPYMQRSFHTSSSRSKN